MLKYHSKASKYRQNSYCSKISKNNIHIFYNFLQNCAWTGLFNYTQIKKCELNTKLTTYLRYLIRLLIHKNVFFAIKENGKVNINHNLCTRISRKRFLLVNRDYYFFYA